MILWYLGICYFAMFAWIVVMHDWMLAKFKTHLEEDDDPRLIGMAVYGHVVWAVLMTILFVSAPLWPPLLIWSAVSSIWSAIAHRYHKWKVRRMFNRLKTSLRVMTKVKTPESQKLMQTFDKLETVLEDKDHM